MKAILSVLLFAAILIGNAQSVSTARATNLKQVLDMIEYPEEAKAEITEGNVVLLVTVSELGTVKEFTVKNACDEMFTQAVAKVIDNLSFIPAINQEGQSVESVVEIPFKFRLEISGNSIVMD